MQFKIIFKTLAGLMCVLGLLLCVPTLFSALTNQIFSGMFVAISCSVTLIGAAMWLLFRKAKGEVNHRSGFAIVTLSYLLAGLIGALPYLFSGIVPGVSDAIFESFSGFCGAGASVISNLESVDRSILLWRSMTQWLGGLGIILFFIAILPILGIGGVQLFRAEITGPDKDKITPRVRDTAKNLWLIYVALTSIIALGLRYLGMSGFDAVNHAMTSVATGGFSTRSMGIAAFNSTAIEYLLIIAMLLGSISFMLHFRVVFKGDFKILGDTELKSYLIIIAIATCLITIVMLQGSSSQLGLTFKAALFTVVATVTSTGYTNYNYIEWPVFCQLILVMLMLMGGMSASTSGGMKCIRIVSAFKLLLNELKQVVHPHAYLTVKNNNLSIKKNAINSMWAFLFIYLWMLSALVLILTLDKLDIATAVSAGIAALSNIGPALGSLGPYASYAELTDLSKISLAFGMVLGRLEFFTVLVLFTPEYWRK